MSTIQSKLEILSSAAKYDVSCSSSGTKSNTPAGGLGNTAAMGICHSFTEDGRCVSLLKLLLTNVCIYDCAYCMNRRSNDIPRATFRVSEVVQLTLEFYRRNFIEGLFLSSGIIRNPDYTMEALVRVAKELREEHGFGGYIHLKTIPGASPELIELAGFYADRLSVNIELPSEASLKLLAPEKSMGSTIQPMNQIARRLQEGSNRPRLLPGPAKASVRRRFVPAGQSTQMIIGATPDTDFQIIGLAASLYGEQKLKRVYYSAYIPLNQDKRLPTLLAPPLRRENRLYQADWLMRFYQYRHDEIVDANHPFLDPLIDPKLSWALRHPEFFPLDLNTADYEMLLRVPGIGVRSARMIVQGRRYSKVRLEHLKSLGIAFNRAKYFIVDPNLPRAYQKMYPEQVRMALTPQEQQVRQLSLFQPNSTQLLSYGTAH